MSNDGRGKAAAEFEALIPDDPESEVPDALAIDDALGGYTEVADTLT